MEIGGTGSHAPWNMPTEPKFDTELIEIYARYVKLHHALIPYTAAQADLASTEGLPIARAMIFDFPNDARFADSWDQYMYGPDLLVAPIWQIGSRERQVLIPEGVWKSVLGPVPIMDRSCHYHHPRYTGHAPSLHTRGSHSYSLKGG